MVDDGTELTTENGKKITVTSGSMSMRHKLTGLTGKTRYRVRAYAINAKGISYGGYTTFTTEDADKPNPERVITRHREQTPAVINKLQ